MITSQSGGEDQFSALHFASFNGNHNLVLKLISLGAD